MRCYRGPYLSARPGFLLTAQLPYDDLLRSPERFAGRLYGCAFRSFEGGKAPGSTVFQWRIFLALEFLLASLVFGRAFCSAGRGPRDHLSPIDPRACLCPPRGW